MKRFALLSCFLFVVGFSNAQHKFLFHSQNVIGLLEGEDGSAFQFQTINGVQHGTWFAGIGTGFDWYLYRSVPLFVSLNKDFKLSNRTFYLSLDGGSNFPWISRDVDAFSNFTSSKFSSGGYWGTGIGYKAGFKNKKDAIILNLGYSFKRLKEIQRKPTACINPPCLELVEHYDYKSNRVLLRFGWQF
ncbi:MAG: hypothetical protein H7Y31_16980 [Chitinophagaceae bacterium]|nr:hypothetical protein [Chitinophagaceae bacterium]